MTYRVEFDFQVLNYVSDNRGHKFMTAKPYKRQQNCDGFKMDLPQPYFATN